MCLLTLYMYCLLLLYIYCVFTYLAVMMWVSPLWDEGFSWHLFTLKVYFCEKTSTFASCFRTRSGCTWGPRLCRQAGERDLLPPPPPPGCRRGWLQHWNPAGSRRLGRSISRKGTRAELPPHSHEYCKSPARVLFEIHLLRRRIRVVKVRQALCWDVCFVNFWHGDQLLACRHNCHCHTMCPH